MQITPCKDCTDRHENCHAECDRYKVWKHDITEEKNRIARMKYKDIDLTRRRNEAITRMRKYNK